MNMKQMQDAFLKSVLNAPKGSRLDIYRANSIGIRVNALSLIFPKVLEVVGVNTFEAVATHYVLDFDSTDVSLDREGRYFEQRWKEIISEHEGYTELQYIPDLVRLEQNIHGLRFKTPNLPFDWESAFANQGLDNARFKRSDPVYLMHSNWSLVSLFDDKIRHHGWIVVRLQNGQPKISPVNEEMANFLNSDQTLQELHDSGLESDVIESAIRKGWVCGLIFTETSTC